MPSPSSSSAVWARGTSRGFSLALAGPARRGRASRHRPRSAAPHRPQPDADGGYPLLLPARDGSEVAGRLRLFDEPLVDALNVAVHLLQSPESLAWLLEAAGAVALERCGAILDERLSG